MSLSSSHSPGGDLEAEQGESAADPEADQVGSPLAGAEVEGMAEVGGAPGGGRPVVDLDLRLLADQGRCADRRGAARADLELDRARDSGELVADHRDRV